VYTYKKERREIEVEGEEREGMREKLGLSVMPLSQ